MTDQSSRRPPFASVLVSAMLAALGGCVVGPDYARPAPPLEAGFIVAGASAVDAQPIGADVAVFWRGFGDPLLSRLVEQGLAANGDVRVAAARLQETRADQVEADAAALPLIGFDSSATRSQLAAAQLPGASRSQRTGNRFDTSFVASWELDVFGRVQRGREAATALTDASAAGLGAVHISIAAEIARNYLELRGLQLRDAVARDALANQRDSLRIARARFAAGRTTQLDVARATTLVSGTEAALPALQAAIERIVFRLGTLTALPLRPLLQDLSAPAALPGLPVTDLASLPVGTPQAWLQRRPDVVAAERQLAAAVAGIGIARADLFPRISISGLLGLNAVTVGALGTRDSKTASLGAALAWTPFDFGRLRSRVVASEARTAERLANYEQAVMLAVEETEGAFSGFSRNAERAQRLDAAARGAQEAARLAKVRYEAGMTDFLVVLDADREVLSNRDRSIQARIDTATSLVAVYRALGGGWSSATHRGGARSTDGLAQ